MPYTFKTTTDLREPNREIIWNCLASVGDANAHRIVVGVTDGKKPVNLSGATAELSVLRQDGATRHVPAEIDADGYAAATLDRSCYEVAGSLRCTMLIMLGDMVISAARVWLLLDLAYGDAVVDPSHVIPSLQDLLNEIDAMRRATEATKAATDSANDAAGRANTAAENADSKAQTAQEAAAKIDGMTVSASTLAPGTAATAEISEVDGHKHVSFGIPAGQTGATPKITFTAKTGEPGTQVQIAQGGTAEAPTIDLTIPRGDPGKDGTGTGTVTAVKVSGVVHEPDDYGVVDLGKIGITLDADGNGTLTLEGGSA